MLLLLVGTVVARRRLSFFDFLRFERKLGERGQLLARHFPNSFEKILIYPLRNEENYYAQKARKSAKPTHQGDEEHELLIHVFQHGLRKKVDEDHRETDCSTQRKG